MIIRNATIILLLLMGKSLFSQPQPSPDDFNAYFQDVKLNHASLELTLKGGGVRFLIKADNKTLKHTDYNQVIVCSPDTTYTFLSRDLNIVITPYKLLKQNRKNQLLPIVDASDSSFYIERHHDKRSVGGERKYYKKLIIKRNAQNRAKFEKLEHKPIAKDSSLIQIQLDNTF